MSRVCEACAVGAPPMEGVTLAWMPPGWVAQACLGEFNGRAGHIRPLPLPLALPAPSEAAV